MDKQAHIQSFLMTNREKFPDHRIPEIENMLRNIPEDKIYYFSAIELKDPTTLLILSIVAGAYGVDRFMLGDTTNGILKLILTNLCCVGFIWVIIDIFNVQGRTREFNYNKFLETYRLNGGDIQ